MSEAWSDPAWTTGEHGEVEEESRPPVGLDLRVARVLEARAHPDADRLLLLTIDAGEPARRQIVAGIAGEYAPETLVGLHIVVVTNLQPAKIRGETSQGMLLAAPVPARAAGEERVEAHLGLLLAPDAEPGERLSAPGLPPPADQITIDDFGRHALIADGLGVTIDGVRVVAPRLVTDRQALGPLR